MAMDTQTMNPTNLDASINTGNNTDQTRMVEGLAEVSQATPKTNPVGKVIKSIRSLQERRKTEVDVFALVPHKDYPPGFLNLTILPSVVTARPYIKSVMTKGASEDWEERMESLPDFLAAGIVSWDLTDDDGNPLPVSWESIDMLGAEIQGIMFQAILESLTTVGEGKNSPSTETSSQESPLQP